MIEILGEGNANRGAANSDLDRRDRRDSPQRRRRVVAGGIHGKAVDGDAGGGVSRAPGVALAVPPITAIPDAPAGGSTGVFGVRTGRHVVEPARAVGLARLDVVGRICGKRRVGRRRENRDNVSNTGGRADQRRDDCAPGVAARVLQDPDPEGVDGPCGGVRTDPDAGEDVSLRVVPGRERLRENVVTATARTVPEVRHQHVLRLGGRRQGGERGEQQQGDARPGAQRGGQAAAPGGRCARGQAPPRRRREGREETEEGGQARSGTPRRARRRRRGRHAPGRRARTGHVRFPWAVEYPRCVRCAHPVCAPGVRTRCGHPVWGARVSPAGAPARRAAAPIPFLRQLAVIAHSPAEARPRQRAGNPTDPSAPARAARADCAR